MWGKKKGKEERRRNILGNEATTALQCQIIIYLSGDEETLFGCLTVETVLSLSRRKLIIKNNTSMLGSVFWCLEAPI